MDPRFAFACQLRGQDSVTCVAVSGSSIFAGSVDGTVRRFDVRMGRTSIDQLHHPVTGLAATRDGLCVLAACTDSTLRLIDVGGGQQLAAYTGHVHAAVKMDCCLTPSDAHVIGSSETGEAVKLTKHSSKGVMASEGMAADIIVQIYLAFLPCGTIVADISSLRHYVANMCIWLANLSRIVTVASLFVHVIHS